MDLAHAIRTWGDSLCGSFPWYVRGSRLARCDISCPFFKIGVVGVSGGAFGACSVGFFLVLRHWQEHLSVGF